MESDPKHDAELARLRGLGAWMREVGAAELVLGDVHIRLASRPNPSAAPRSEAERDEARALDEEKRLADGLSEEERAHNAFWRRITRSSAAGIPPFRRKEPKAPASQ